MSDDALSALPSSFRDPSGYIFQKDGLFYRQVGPLYRAIFDQATQAGLFEQLAQQGLILPHEIVERTETTYTLLPEQLEFLSYPYEWSFSQWKDAALLTLQLQKAALERGFTLKDATAFNIQFQKGKPVFIDTLSFEPYVEGEPWVAYRQFCEHFLAPLALMAKTDIRLGQLFRTHLGGVPLDLASKLLPWSARWNPHLYAHVFLHGAQQQKDAKVSGTPEKASAGKLTKTGLLGILESLTTAVNGLTWQPAGTEWGDYYNETNYTEQGKEEKHRLVEQFLDQVTIPVHSVWDLGANTGVFSRLASKRGIFTVAWDIDPAAVEKNYRQVRGTKESNLLPLLQDLTNPSSALGWNLAERESVFGRRQPDVALALALIHHLAIGNNVPLPLISDFLAKLSPWLIIEFVTKEDSQTKKLLHFRKDIFPSYTKEGFEAAFAPHWTIAQQAPLPGNQRFLYLLQRRQ